MIRTGIPPRHPAANMIPAISISKVPNTVLSQKTDEYASHMIPFARLYAATSEISDSFTVLPDQNHIGFLRFHAKMPIPVNNRLMGIMIASHMMVSIAFVTCAPGSSFLRNKGTAVPTNRIFSLLDYFPMNQNTPFVLAFSIKHFCFPFTIIKASSIQKRIYRRIYAVPEFMAYWRTQILHNEFLPFRKITTPAFCFSNSKFHFGHVFPSANPDHSVRELLIQLRFVNLVLQT